MFVPSVVVLLSISAALAVGIAVLFVWQRRHERAVTEFSGQMRRLTFESGTAGRGTKLRGGEQLFQRVVETVHDAVMVHRERILFANARFLALLGLRAADVIGKPLSDFVGPEYVELVDTNLRRRLNGEPAAERYEVELVGMQGVLTRIELSSSLIYSDGKAALALTALEMMPESRPRSMVTLDAMGESVITVDTEGGIDYINHSAEALLGQRKDQVMGKSFAEVASLIDEIDRRSLGDPVRMALNAGSRVSMGRRAVLVPVNGAPERSVELSVSPLTSDAKEALGLVLVLHDTSEWRGLARQMTYQASHDALTGLVNRREFARRLEEAMESARSGTAAHAVCYLDLDRFKVVNDTCGHTAGDNMLRGVAAIIKEAVRDSDTVGRIGGDEFALLLVGCPLEKARQIADDVVRSVRDYNFVWKDRSFNIGVSIGLVEIGQSGGDIEDLMSSADSACYVAKKRGGLNVHVYSAREEAAARHNGEIQWLQKLQGALRDHKFELYHQQIVPARVNTLRGPAIEVLLRLPGENGEPGAAPAEFIRAAERYRLMPDIDRWVVQAVLSALGRGGMKLPPGRSVAINIAGQTLGDTDFLEFVVDCFDHTGARPADLCFELTESAVLANIDHARRFIGVLHGMGCEFALDDFGSGSSSLATLKALPMDYLKIDGSFIRSLAVDSVNQAMVAAMVELSRSLNFRIVAEQVEDQISLDTVKSLGIDFVQGYIIGAPQPLSVTPAAS